MTLTLTNPYKKGITSKNRSTQTQISLSIWTKILSSQRWKLVQSTGPNKSTTTLLTALTDSSKFIKFINGMGLFVGHLENMTHFGDTETLPIFPISPGVCPQPFKTWLRVRYFHYCHYSAKSGKESICRGIPRRSGLREHRRPCYLWGFSHCHSHMPLHVE